MIPGASIRDGSGVPGRWTRKLHSKHVRLGGWVNRSSPNHSVDYLCGNCGTTLLHAEDGLTHNLLILCTECGARNSSDALTIPARRGIFK